MKSEDANPQHIEGFSKIVTGENIFDLPKSRIQKHFLFDAGKRCNDEITLDFALRFSTNL